MRIHLLSAIAFLGAGCASPRGIAEGHYPTTIATEQSAVIDEIVERWYDNARSHPSCRSRRNLIQTPEGRLGIGELDFFARLRSPTVLVFSRPVLIEERTEFEADGHGSTYPEEYYTLYRFERATILYAQDSDYVRLWPTSFQLSESARGPRIPSDFVSSDRTYLLFANFIEYEPLLDALVVCELSDPATLPSILGDSAQ